jgi:UDP-N-acetylglucosamine acyltransferase
MPQIDSTAFVADGAKLADDVVVGRYCSIGPEVEIGAGTELRQGVIVEGRTIIGERNQFFPYSVIGIIPQDKKYQGEPTRLEIGSDNVIREHATVHIGTEGGGGLTKIGSKNLLMAGSHVGHDCFVGDHCILSNGAGLAGHVIVGDWVIMGGQTGIHQFVRLGSHCMTSGGSKVGKDVPPFTIAQGYPARLRGINHVGLRRRGFSNETIRALRTAYRAIFKDDVLFEQALEQVRADYAGSHEVTSLLDFLAEAQSSDRGFLRPARSEDNGAPSDVEDEVVR